MELSQLPPAGPAPLGPGWPTRWPRASSRSRWEELPGTLQRQHEGGLGEPHSQDHTQIPGTMGCLSGHLFLREKVSLHSIMVPGWEGDTGLSPDGAQKKGRAQAWNTNLASLGWPDTLAQ